MMIVRTAVLTREEFVSVRNLPRRGRSEAVGRAFPEGLARRVPDGAWFAH